MIPATSLSHRGDENNLDNDSRNSDSGKSVAIQNITGEKNDVVKTTHSVMYMYIYHLH